MKKHLLSSLTILNQSFMKGLVAICIWAAFFVCFFSPFPTYKWSTINCPNGHQPLIYTSYCQSTNRCGEDKTNISHILFGIGGSTETWGWRRRYSELWWKPNITRGFVWLDKEPEERWPDTSPPYKVSGDTSRFKYTNWGGSRAAVRLARIVKESFELGLENVRWFVMGDDDTVFFPENLVSLLNKYDHKQRYYIGANSESVEQNVFHSYTIAYGGGGFAISYPLAAEVVRILDGCIDRYAEFYGSDRKVGGCISDEIGVTLTIEPGFHQMDIRGSPFGLLSAHPISPLISLHHLDYVQALFPDASRVNSIKRLNRAYKLDPSRIVQHSICYDPTRNWSISISWGYNVQIYPFLITPSDLNTPLQTFLTWGSWSHEPFTFNTRVLNFDPCERPIIYYFERINGAGHGRSTTSYRRPHRELRKQCTEVESYESAYLVEEINVSAAVLDPGVWKKGPRRQCCEIINGSDQADGVLQIRIRGCNQWESITPP